MPQQDNNMTSQISTLILQAQTEDKEAVNQLLLILQPLIRQRIYHQSIAVSDCDDLLQEISLKICKSISQYSLSTTIPFDHFLNRLIKTTKYDYFRRQSRLNKQKESLIEEAKYKYCSGVMDNKLENSLLAEEALESLISYCKKLSKLEREVVQYILDDYSPKETAEAMGVSEKIVYNALYRCKTKLRKQFEQYN